MDDLISRVVDKATVLETFSDLYEVFDDNKAIQKELNAVYDRINALPSAQPEIIRCKDCVHCADDWEDRQPMFTCELGRCGESVQPNDFCSYAERRNDG